MNSNKDPNAVGPAREVIIPTVTMNAGYEMAIVGKWRQICLGPDQWKFDEYLVFIGCSRYWIYRVEATVPTESKDEAVVAARAGLEAALGAYPAMVDDGRGRGLKNAGMKSGGMRRMDAPGGATPVPEVAATPELAHTGERAAFFRCFANATLHVTIRFSHPPDLVSSRV